MQYSFLSATILAFAASVFAAEPTPNFDAISLPAQDQNVAAGSTLTIKWQPSTVHPGPVTIALLQGPTPGLLDVGQTIAAGVDQTTGSYSWPVPADLKSFATYGISITLDSSAADPKTIIFQYGFPFHITGLTGASSSYATGSTTTVHLSTGPSYTASPLSTSTSTSTSSSSSVKSSSAVYTTKSATTTSYVASTTSAYSNTTVTTLKPTTSATVATTTSLSGAANSTSTTKPVATGNSASSNFAQGGLALVGGLVIAFFL